MLICFSGWKGAGKDECAKYLIERHNAIRVALADPLKNMVSKEYGVDRSSLDDPKRKELPILEMPVEPKDAYTKMIAEFMFKEFRNKIGLPPHDFYWSEHGFVGVFKNRDFEGRDSNMTLYDHLYWTPRALAILKGSTNRAVNPNFWTDKAFESIEDSLGLNRKNLVVVTDVRYKSELVQFKERFGKDVVFVRVNRFKESPSQDPSERDLDDAEFDFYVDNTRELSWTHEQLEEILAQLDIV